MDYHPVSFKPVVIKINWQGHNTFVFERCFATLNTNKIFSSRTSANFYWLHSTTFPMTVFQKGWQSCKALELFSGDTRFEFQPGYGLSWQRCFVVFFFPPGKFLESTFIRSPRLPSESFPILLSLIIMPFEYHSLVSVLNISPLLSVIFWERKLRPSSEALGTAVGNAR